MNAFSVITEVGVNMQKKTENRFQLEAIERNNMVAKLSHMVFPTRSTQNGVLLPNLHVFSSSSSSEPYLTLGFTQRDSEKYQVSFLQRLRTPKGDATVVGVANGALWFWIDGHNGICHWDNLESNAPKFFGTGALSPTSEEYPEALSQTIEGIFGVDPIGVEFICNYGKNGYLLFEEIFSDLNKDVFEADALKDLEQLLDAYFRQQPTTFSDKVLNCLGTIEKYFLNRQSIDITFDVSNLETLETQIKQALAFCDSNIQVPINSLFLTTNDFWDIPVTLRSAQSILMELKSLQQEDPVLQELLTELITKQNELIVVPKKLTTLENKLSDIYQRIINFTINYFLDYRKTFSQTFHLQHNFAKVAAGLARFIHDNGSLLFGQASLTNLKEKANGEVEIIKTPEEEKTLKEINDQKYMLSFIFFMLAGVSNSNLHKKSCFIYFLNETALTPSSFDIETYCKNHADKFITFINFLKNHPLYQEQITLGLQNDCLPLLFEDIKLAYLYGRALTATDSQEQEQIHSEIVKKSLASLLSKLPEKFDDKDPYTVFYKEVINFTEIHFVSTESLNDFDIMVNLTRFYLMTDIKKGKSLLTELSVLKSSGDIRSEATYAQLLLTYSSCRDDHQKALAIARSHIKQDSNYLLGILKSLPPSSPSIYTLAYLYLDGVEDIKGIEIDSMDVYDHLLTEVKKNDTPEAHYVLYALRNYPDEFAIEHIIKAAKHGFTPAIEELFRLANLEHNEEVCFYLGKMFLNGEGVQKNVAIAIEFLEKCHLESAKFELAKIVLETDLEISVNPIPGLKSLLSSRSKLFREEAQRLLNLLAEKDRFKIDAMKALSDENKNIDISALVQNTFLASGKQQALENKFTQQVITTMKNTISRQLQRVLHATSSTEEITFINQKLGQLATITSVQELDILIDELRKHGICDVVENNNNNVNK